MRLTHGREPRTAVDRRRTPRRRPRSRPLQLERLARRAASARGWSRCARGSRRRPSPRAGAGCRPSARPAPPAPSSELARQRRGRGAITRAGSGARSTTMIVSPSSWRTARSCRNDPRGRSSATLGALCRHGSQATTTGFVGRHRKGVAAAPDEGRVVCLARGSPGAAGSLPRPRRRCADQGHARGRPRGRERPAGGDPRAREDAREDARTGGQRARRDEASRHAVGRLRRRRRRAPRRRPAGRPRTAMPGRPDRPARPTRRGSRLPGSSTNASTASSSPPHRIRVVSDSEEYSNASPRATRPGATVSLTIRRPPGSTSASSSWRNRAPAWGISGSGDVLHERALGHAQRHPLAGAAQVGPVHLGRRLGGQVDERARLARRARSCGRRPRTGRRWGSGRRGTPCSGCAGSR